LAFRKRFFRRLESDKGYIVKQRYSFRELPDAFSHSYMEYREGYRIARVVLHPSEGALTIFLDEPVKWLPPYDREPIPEEKRKEILGNIVEALRFCKSGTRVIERMKGREKLDALTKELKARRK
jgi:hypothetical protein